MTSLVFAAHTIMKVWLISPPASLNLSIPHFDIPCITQRSNLHHLSPSLLPCI